MTTAAAHIMDSTPLPTINFALDEPDELADDTPPRRVSELAQAGNAVSAIEAMPHLTRQIIRLWNSRELNTLIHNILLDSRDGSRQGFPIEVARELMFLAKMNLITRAQDAAPMLGIGIGEACRLIEKGDHAALGNKVPAQDIWGHSPRPRNGGERSAPAPRPQKIQRVLPIEAVLSPVLQEAPPIPPSVCLDLTTSRLLRDHKTHVTHDAGDVMDQGFFRCIAKELGNLKIPQLVLSDLGKVRRCAWLPSAIGFAKNRCHFSKVILQVDPLSAHDELLVMAMAAGLDQLVINFNLASGKWRNEAEALLATDPRHFLHKVRRLLASRDEITRKTGHHCTISVIQINHKSVFHLSQTFLQVAGEPGLDVFHHIAESRHKENSGACHCWSPFIEAHIRTNGHLVACAQDHSGYSFTADLKQITFTDAWHGQIFRMARQRVLHGEKTGRLCEICPHRATPGNLIPN